MAETPIFPLGAMFVFLSFDFACHGLFFRLRFLSVRTFDNLRPGVRSTCRFNFCPVLRQPLLYYF